MKKKQKTIIVITKDEIAGYIKEISQDEKHPSLRVILV
jgi:hypothetical protein